ncbi:MAG: hypothetical protein IPH97_05115 [Ignavibacteriales bacterium]|nr:hypothetical protein [Ignavibacteriales bacterium]
MKSIYAVFALLLNISIFAQNHDKELRDLYYSAQFNQLVQVSAEYLESDSLNPVFNLWHGEGLVELGFFEEGKPYVQKAIENIEDNDTRKPWALNYLARIEFLSQNKLKAKQLFIDCINSNTNPKAIESSKYLLVELGLHDFYSEFEVVESEHITFHFQPNSIVSNIDEFVELRENAIQKISEFFGVKIPKKIDFIVWNSNEDAKKIGIKSLGFANPQFCVIHSRPNQTLGHEITHVITHYLANDQIKTRFINEGIAVWFDLSNNNRLEIINNQKEKDSTQAIVSIKEAWNNPTVYPEWVYYTLAGEFINRILDKWGRENLVELLKNQTYDNAVLIYGNEIDEVIFKLENEINSN